MPFRNPLYLDVETLLNVADYAGIDVPGAAEVTRRRVDDRRRRGGLNKVVEIGGESGTEEEITEKFATTFRPVRAVNDVIDELQKQGDVLDLSNADQMVTQRALVDVEGTLAASPVTEVGSILGAVIAPLLDALRAGAEELDEDAIRAAGLAAMTGNTPATTHVFNVDVDNANVRSVVVARPDHLFGSATFEDLDGEHAVFGMVDQVVRQGEELSLQRYLLPGLNRTLRRSVAQADLDDMLRDLSEFGIDADVGALVVPGPAVVVSPIAIY